MRFRKRPVEIEAFQWTGGPDQLEDPIWIIEAIRDRRVQVDSADRMVPMMLIRTLEGTMIANRGDWIIRGVEGEIYPCKPSIFEATYEPCAD